MSRIVTFLAVLGTVLAGGLVLAQQPEADAPVSASPANLETITPKPEPVNPAAANAGALPPDPAPIAEEVPPPKVTKPVVAPAALPPPPPPLPPPPVRSPVAVIEVLDKSTAETLRFAAPVGRRVRYKALVFTVKACETRGLSDPLPQSSAYLTIEAGAADTRGAQPKIVFKGWMFASAPSLHALEHPIYDAWLIACSTASPVG